MKKAAELEQELVGVGLLIYAIVKERGVCHEDYYSEDEAFCKLIEDYKPLFNTMYKQAEEEGYYWRFCSLETYVATYNERLNQYLESEDGEEESDFLDLESERSIEYKPTAPILLERAGAPRVYCSNLDVLSTSIFSSKVLLKKLKLDQEEKTLFYEEKVLLVEEQKAEERRARKERVLQLANPEGIGRDISSHNEEDENNEVAMEEANPQLSILSLVEWGMVYYYMVEARLIPPRKTKLEQMRDFIKEKGLNVKVETFSSKQSQATVKIVKLDGRSLNSLKATISNLKKVADYLADSEKAEEKCLGDIFYIHEHMKDLES